MKYKFMMQNMTESIEHNPKKYLKWLILFFIIPLPWLIIKSLSLFGVFKFNYEQYALFSAILTGISIIAGAFLVTWAAESSQEYFPPNLVLALIAIINVIPEYVVDIYFTWVAGKNPEYTHYAISNMTGANRMLIGIVWPLILLTYIFAKMKKNPSLPNYIQMEKSNILEIFFLFISTVYCFILPLKQKLEIVDTIVLFSMFGFYIYLATKMGKREPELEGPPYYISTLPEFKKKLLIFFMFLYSALVFLASAEPFGESLLVLGSHIAAKLGVDPTLAKFLMVQWVAPIASESPEIIVVIIFALKLLATDSFSTVVSSKINQWTLLVGFIPLVYLISLIYHGNPASPMFLDSLQREEILLTAAQSFFALIILIDFKFTPLKAVLLFVPFIAQLIKPEIRMEVTYLYFILSFIMLLFLVRKNNVLNLKEAFIEVFGVIKGKNKE